MCGSWGRGAAILRGPGAHHSAVCPILLATSCRGQAWVWTSLATMPALPRGPPGGIPAHCRSWHKCWSSSGKPRSTTTPRRRAMCLISRSHCPTPRVRGACGGWEMTSAPGTITSEPVHLQLVGTQGSVAAGGRGPSAEPAGPCHAPRPHSHA